MMRIQETDRILKESRDSRHAARQQSGQSDGLFSRVWKGISHLPLKLMGKNRE